MGGDAERVAVSVLLLLSCDHRGGWPGWSLRRLFRAVGGIIVSAMVPHSSIYWTAARRAAADRERYRYQSRPIPSFFAGSYLPPRIIRRVLPA